MPKATKVIVTQDEDHPVEKNVLAAAIVQISSSLSALQKGGLTREAIDVLTQYNCRSPWTNKSKPTLTEVRAVLDSLVDLKHRFTTKG